MAARHPLLVAGLTQLLRQELVTGAAEQQPATATLADADQALLEALGYLAE